MLRTTKQTATPAENITVAFVIRQDHSDRLAEIAKSDDRSVSSVIRLILDEYFAALDSKRKAEKVAA